MLFPSAIISALSTTFNVRKFYSFIRPFLTIKKKECPRYRDDDGDVMHKEFEITHVK